MTVSNRSRYRHSEVSRLDGAEWLSSRATPPVAPERGRAYYANADDRVDLLTARFGRPPQQWWQLAEDNPQKTLWFGFSNGEKVNVRNG